MQADDRFDDIDQDLALLAELPLADRPAVFERLDTRLATALRDDSDPGRPPQPGVGH